MTFVNAFYDNSKNLQTLDLIEESRKRNTVPCERRARCVYDVLMFTCKS